MSEKSLLPEGYAKFLADVKARIQAAQVRAGFSVNRELIVLCWYLGREIVERQKRLGWGASVIERLSFDLQRSFPGIGGFSTRNIWRMRAFYLAYAELTQKLPQAVAELAGEKLPHVVAEIPWGQNILILEKIKDSKKRFWYAQKTLQNGWSRAVLWHHIDTHLYERQTKTDKMTNFGRTLPSPQSDLALEMIKDPYNFDFLTVAEKAHERDLERGLVEHIRKFLLELGMGFSFVGSQVPLKVENQDFYLDLLFYHLKLRCYIILELKMTEFQPEFAGKMNFYLSAV